MEKSLEKYAEWLEEAIGEIVERQPDAISVCAILPGGEVLTGYFNCGYQDKVIMGHYITADATMDSILVNADKIVAAAQQQEEGEEDDD